MSGGDCSENRGNHVRRDCRWRQDVWPWRCHSSFRWNHQAKEEALKGLYGTSHTLSEDEARFVFEKGCDEIIMGSGQMGNVHLSPEAKAYFEKHGCKVLLKPTAEAITAFNRSHGKKVGLIHVTAERSAFVTRWYATKLIASSRLGIAWLASPILPTSAGAVAARPA